MTDKDNDILLHIIRHCDRVKEDLDMFGNTFDDFEAINAFRDSVCMNIFANRRVGRKIV